MTAPRRIIATSSLLIVCKEGFVAQMNATLATIDSAGSPNVLSAELCQRTSPSGPVVARWTLWKMDDEQRSSITVAFGQDGWRPLRGSEGKALGPGDPVPAFSTNQRWWLWDGQTTSPSHALSSLGLTPLDVPEG